jgi:hypothetical protein
VNDEEKKGRMEEEQRENKKRKERKEAKSGGCEKGRVGLALFTDKVNQG